jgi:hypothetical protein
MVSIVDMVTTASRWGGASANPTLGGGDFSTGIIFRPLRPMTITGARFWSMSAASPFDIITWALKLWDMDSLTAVASGSHTTAAANEGVITNVTFGAPKVIGAGDVNRPFGLTFRDISGALVQASALAPYTSLLVGVGVIDRFLSRDIFCAAIDAYAAGDGPPALNWGADFAFAVEPIFTVP